MKSPGEPMEKRRNIDQHVLQHGEIRCEHLYIYSCIYIYIFISMCLFHPCILQ